MNNYLRQVILLFIVWVLMTGRLAQFLSLVSTNGWNVSWSNLLPTGGFPVMVTESSSSSGSGTSSIGGLGGGGSGSGGSGLSIGGSDFGGSLLGGGGGGGSSLLGTGVGLVEDYYTLGAL